MGSFSEENVLTYIPDQGEKEMSVSAGLQEGKLRVPVEMESVSVCLAESHITVPLLNRKKHGCWKEVDGAQ